MPTTTVTINTRDARDVRALKMFERAGSWLKTAVRLPDGRMVKAYGIESASEPGVYRLVNLRQCSCPDFQYRQDGHDFRCAHMRAVRWYVDFVKAERRRQEARASTSRPLVDAF
jgi:hypothetical protein